MSPSVNPMAAGILIGVVLTLVVIRVFASRVLIRREKITLTHDRAVQAVLDAATARGWGVPTVHHLHEGSREVGHETQAATVIELCRPDYAAQLLENGDTRAVSVMLPCRLAVYEEPSGAVVVSRMNTALVSRLFGGVAHRVMSRASCASEEIVASLRGSWGG